jgi:hypothetical protein
MSRFGIPANAIIVDPHARHTTTKMRNAARLIYRYGMPFSAKALVTTWDITTQNCPPALHFSISPTGDFPALIRYSRPLSVATSVGPLYSVLLRFPTSGTGGRK